MRAHVIPILLMSATLASTQVREPSRKNGNTTDSIPSHNLEFREAGPIPGIKAPNAIEIPYQFNDGTLYMKVLDPTTLKETVLAIKDGSGSIVPLPEAPTVTSVAQIDSFPVRGGVAFLVSALPADTKSIERAEKRIKQSFIIIANENGQLKKTISLPQGYSYSRLGVIPSGDFVLAAYNPSLDQTSLNLIDDGGNLLKTVDQPMSEDERKHGPTAGNSTHFLATETGLIAWRVDTRDDIVVFGERGAVRIVAIQLPKTDEVIADLEPSDKNWLVHYSVSDLDISGTQQRSTMNYYEVSPLDGRIVRSLSVGGHFIYSIACESNGTFWGFAADSKGGLVKYLAE